MRVVLGCLLICLSFQAMADSDQLSIDEETWKERIEEIDYSEEPTKKKKENENQETSNTSEPWINQETVKSVSYVLVAIIVIIVLVVILTRYKPSSEIKPHQRVEAQTIAEAEENLPMVTLNKIFDEALEKGDYRSALRINFLMILQRMIDAQLIIWNKRKTNEHYLQEIKDESVILPFGMIVGIFDDVWYGEAQITAKQFEGIRANFETLNANIHGDEK